jgi:hypothetical protein
MGFNPFDDYGSGGGTPATLIEKDININGVYIASEDEANGYSKVVVSVPNTYVAEDEGKVVSNGALVAQGSTTIVDNGTIDTTLYNSITINVPQALPDNALAPIFTNNVQIITGNVEEVQ